MSNGKYDVVDTIDELNKTIQQLQAQLAEAHEVIEKAITTITTATTKMFEIGMDEEGQSLNAVRLMLLSFQYTHEPKYGDNDEDY